jgi:drug/metabolite transporter (DMT)-like permease
MDGRRLLPYFDPEDSRRTAAGTGHLAVPGGLGVLLIGCGNGGVVWAEQSVPSGLTAVLVSSTPFWMIGIEQLMPDGERITRHVLGLLIGFCGIVVLVWPEIRVSESRGFLGGVLATQLACVGWALGSVCARRRRQDENVLAGVALKMVAAGLCLSALALATGKWASLRFTQRTSTAVLYLLFMGSIVGFSGTRSSTSRSRRSRSTRTSIQSSPSSSGRSCSASRSAHELP